MKAKAIFLWVFLLMVTPVFAQTPSTTAEEERDVLPQPVRKSKVPIWLHFSAGANYAECFDKGTIPFRYKGFGANAKGGITIEWGRCHVQTEGQGFYNALSDLNGSSINVNLTTEFLYRFHDSAKNRWHYWAGGQTQTFVDVREIPMLMNASWSVSAFVNLGATGMVQYDFAFNRDKTHHWLTAYGKLDLPLMGVVDRPGFAYIGNPTINEDALLGDDIFVKFFLGASTELGLYLNLLNDNRIGLSYRWDYLTTGKKGIYRYDNALHAINLNFMFKIN